MSEPHNKGMKLTKPGQLRSLSPVLDGQIGARHGDSSNSAPPGHLRDPDVCMVLGLHCTRLCRPPSFLAGPGPARGSGTGHRSSRRDGSIVGRSRGPGFVQKTGAVALRTRMGISSYSDCPRAKAWHRWAWLCGSVVRGRPLWLHCGPSGAMLPALWVVYLFAAVEELGWRGFALPRLLASRSAVVASLILGSIHEVWHWPLILLPHQFLSGVPILAHTVSVVAEAVVLTWVFRSTGGSVLMVTLFHGSSNVAMVLYDAIDPRWMPWFRSITTLLVSVALFAFVGPGLGSRESRGRPTTE